ncbi:MAG: type II toxin-antitoxin system RelE/ParE family toxin [Flavobacteriales bacterium]|jgi:mRNA-degrading endonuclease RelE of RelBE toxin-antitoxin system|nr:type II toxin-antitoxin system RelE/ParE family toxin [Flavobacteriales bacterium]
MSYSVKTISKFDKSLKKLIKKFPSLKEEFIILVKNLKENPEQGTPLGKNCYKIRLAIKSKGKGKSGGARIITNIVVSDTIVYLLSIYNKSEKQDLSDKELEEILKSLPD